MKQTPSYRAIIHGPILWRGATRAADAEQRPPFIVAFEPQNDLLIVKQGIVELEEMAIDDTACDSQILSIFFFDTHEQALEAEKILSTSLYRLQTIYDIFKNTRPLEILEQALGSVHIPLQIVANRMELSSEKSESSRFAADGSIAVDGVESYSIRTAVSQGLSIVTPELDLVECMREAVTNIGPNINRISINFYPVTKMMSIAQTPVNLNTPYFARKSAKSTPRNIMKGTTPSVRLGKAVVDLYSMRGLISQPNSVGSVSQGKEAIVDTSPIIKAAISAHEFEEAMASSKECLRSVSQDQYISTEELKGDDPIPVTEDEGKMIMSNYTEGVNDITMTAAHPTNDIPPNSERSNYSGISEAAEMAVQFFSVLNPYELEGLDLQETSKCVSISSARLINPDAEEVDKSKRENQKLSEFNTRNLEEIKSLHVGVEASEGKLKSQIDQVKEENQLETTRLSQVLREKERIMTELISSGSCGVKVEKEDPSEIMELNGKLDSLVMEKKERLKEVELHRETESILKELESFKPKYAEIKKPEGALEQIKKDKEGMMAMIAERIPQPKNEIDLLPKDSDNQKGNNNETNLTLEVVNPREAQLLNEIRNLEGDVMRLNEKCNDLTLSNSALKDLEKDLVESKRREVLLAKKVLEARTEKDKLKDDLQSAFDETTNMKMELESARNSNKELWESLKLVEETKLKLEKQVSEAKVREDKLRLEKSDALDRCFKEKLKCDNISKQYEQKCRRLSDQLKVLQMSCDTATKKCDELSTAYASYIVRSCINASRLGKQLEQKSNLVNGFVGTVMKLKADGARGRCQIRYMAQALQMPKDSTDKQIVEKLRRPKMLDPAIGQKIKMYEKLSVAYTELKNKNAEQQKLLDSKNSSYQRLLDRHEGLKEENRRLISALAEERKRLATMEVVAKKQVKEELTKTNEEKRMLYARQCELSMQNEGLREQIGTLKQELSSLRLNSIDVNRQDRYNPTSKCSSIDAQSVVMEKLNRMRTVFDKGDERNYPLRNRISDTTLGDTVSIEPARSYAYSRQPSTSRPLIPTSPCAYKDTKASLYSRRATLQKMRSREVKTDERFENPYGDGTMKQRKPWVF